MSSPSQPADTCAFTALRSRCPLAAAGLTLRTWLAARFRYFDQDQWLAHLGAGRVQVNGAPAGPDLCLRTGDEIVFFPEPSRDARADVRVVHADADLVVVDKPPHAIVQQASAFLGHTFVAAVAAQFPPQPGTDRLEPAHRLDRETSGVLVLSRSKAASRDLQRQFASGNVHKEYLAVAQGVVAADRLAIDAAIGPASGSRVAARRAVVPADATGARPAITDLTVVRRLGAATVVRLHPRTGRTHQIRVHLEHLGHPLVGDKLYGQSDEHWLDYVRHLKADGDPRWMERAAVGRHLLHAERLRLAQPSTGEQLDFSAAPPPDFAAYLAAAEGSLP